MTKTGKERFLTNHFLGENRIVVEGNLHGPNRANGDAKTAPGTSFGIEHHRHFRSFDEQRPGRTDAGAGTTLKTIVVVTPNPGCQPFDFHPHTLEVIEAGNHIGFSAAL
jgi:hypothetical protein